MRYCSGTTSGNPTPRAIEVATYRIRDAGIDLERAVVISEEEHDNDYYMQDDLEVVFVCPPQATACGSRPHTPNADRSGPSRYGQIADGLYAERYLALFQTVLRTSDLGH